MHHRIRIVVAGAREVGTAILVDAIRGEPDLELAAVVADPGELPAVVRRGDVDVVIAEADEAEGPDFFASLLYECPRLRVLVLSLRGADTVLCELRPHRVSLGNVSMAELLDAVRAAAAAPAVPTDWWANEL